MAVNFEIIPGDIQSPVILHVPHASRFIPADVRSELLLSDAELLEELNSMTDSRTDEIALGAREKSELKPWLFINRFSRLVIDPERFPDDREIMNKVGMGAVYRKTSNGKDLRSPEFQGEKALLDAYFHPYSKALEELVTERLNALGQVTIMMFIHIARSNTLMQSIMVKKDRPCALVPMRSTLLQSSQTPLEQAFHLSEMSLRMNHMPVPTFL